MEKISKIIAQIILGFVLICTLVAFIILIQGVQQATGTQVEQPRAITTATSTNMSVPTAATPGTPTEIPTLPPNFGADG